MNKANYKILGNRPLTGGTGLGSVWEMILEGDTGHITAPGQFVNIALPARYLRRPISICRWDEKTITLIYRIVGSGTMDLSQFPIGAQLQMLTGLGNGFSTEGCRAPLLVGGGVGLPPVLGLTEAFLARGIKPIVAAGFNTKNDAFLLEEFEKLGVKPLVATMDGTLGAKGTVMDLLTGLKFDKIYACGPKPMLKALAALDTPAELSVEERMGCGIGVCMGCTCKTTNGMKRICKDGPVFKKEEIIW